MPISLVNFANVPSIAVLTIGALSDPNLYCAATLAASNTHVLNLVLNLKLSFGDLVFIMMPPLVFNPLIMSIFSISVGSRIMT